MTNPTPHGQVPEALIDLIDAYAETRHRCGGIYNARTEAARKAVIEALSGVQALSAAPAGWKLVPEDATEEMVRATDKVNFANADTDGTMHNVWNVMLAASPTPPAEQQATKETSGGFHVWRDISTAPKDGSRFVATGHNYGLYSEVRHTCVAQWFLGCWMEASDWNETSELKYLTHWMPLPSPPDDVAAPAEQQAEPGVAYAELPEKYYLAGGEVPTWDAKQMHAFADATHTLREALSEVQALSAGPGASRAAPPSTYVNGAGIRAEDGASAVIRKLDARFHDIVTFKAVDAAASPTPPAEQAAPKAAPGVGNSGFDHQTAADFLSGKTVSDEAVRKFVAASRWAHDERAALSATLLAMHGVLTSREAEIALLKKALLEAEAAPKAAPWEQNESAYQRGYMDGMAKGRRDVDAAPQQEAQEPTTVDKKTMELAESVGLIGPASRVGDLHAAIQRFHDLICVNATIKAAVMAAEAIGKQQAAPQQEAQEPVATLHCNDIGYVWARATEVGTRMRFEQPINLYTAPQPAPAPLSESIDQVERALAIIGVVGAIDGHDVVRRESVLEIARRAALAAQKGKA